MRVTIISAVIVIGNVVLLLAQPGMAITISTVPIGDVGNPNDPATGNRYGGVDYAYNIGKFEVTVGQYRAFLNAVADTDTYALYETSMATDLNIAGISRTGSSGSYSYSVIGSANHPVTFVSWGDAARFANWLHNGQPSGVQGLGTTETGAYTLLGATSDAALMAVTRNANAKWFIPTRNEWYKAAYYQPAAAGGDSDGYWQYPMKTNSVPYSDQPPGATPNNTRVGNFQKDDGLANGYDDGLAVTGSTSSSSTQNYLTDVGAYTLSPSYYGTFDQGGNVGEWKETLYPGPDQRRGFGGGSWGGFYSELQAGALEIEVTHDFQASRLGFRVARLLEFPTGDYNFDGIVDPRDYVIWRSNVGYVVPPCTGGDANCNGFVEWLDYGPWRANYGQTAGSGVSVFDSIPEPTSTTLFSIAAVMLGVSRIRPRR